MKRRIYCLIGYLAIIKFAIRADTLVVPAAQTLQAGNGSISDGFRNGGAWQAVYGSPTFGPAGPIMITTVAFRLDEGLGGRSFDAVIPRISIQLSTYKGTLATFNPSSFDANKGSDSLTVYDGAIHWTSTDLLGAAPNPFDLKLSFSQPFIYDPAAGPLLMNYTAPAANGFPAADLSQHGNSTTGWQGFAGSFGEPGAIVFESIVTQFTFAQVPEPLTVGLLAVGLLMILNVRVRNENL